MMSMPPCIARAATSISGTKISPAENRSPTSAMAGIIVSLSSRPRSPPPSRALVTRAITVSRSPSQIASNSSSISSSVSIAAPINVACACIIRCAFRSIKWNP